MQPKSVKAEEQYRLATECRSSGLTDYQWCLEKGICPGTFYGWVYRLRQKEYENIPEPVDYFAAGDPEQNFVPFH